MKIVKITINNDDQIAIIVNHIVAVSINYQKEKGMAEIKICYGHDLASFILELEKANAYYKEIIEMIETL